MNILVYKKIWEKKTLFPTCEYQTLITGDFRLGHHSQTAEKQVKKDWRSGLHGENSKDSMVPNWPARLLNRPYHNPFGVQCFWEKQIFGRKIENLLTFTALKWMPILFPCISFECDFFMMKRRKKLRKGVHNAPSTELKQKKYLYVLVLLGLSYVFKNSIHLFI